MKKNMPLDRRKNINSEIRRSIDKTLKESSGFLQMNFTNLQIHNYKYIPEIAVEELGLEIDLVNQLVEDYVIQILKSKAIFLGYIQGMKMAKEKSKELDYTPLKNLAHKNLGVARNLRIKDAIKVLDEIMKKDDLEYLALCIEALEFCAIRLNPKCAYETLNLMKIKNSLYSYLTE